MCSINKHQKKKICTRKKIQALRRLLLLVRAKNVDSLKLFILQKEKYSGCFKKKKCSICENDFWTPFNIVADKILLSNKTNLKA